MKFRNSGVVLFAVCILVFGWTSIQGQRTALQTGLNRIEGRVTDETNNGVNNAYVELYDNYGGLVSRQRSTGQGRFSFRGMGPGRYIVAVKPYGTNLVEDSKEIEIDNQYSRSDTQYVEFRLRVDKRFRPEETGVVGTVFVQDVPADAKRRYQSGIQAAQTDPGRSQADLEDAVKIFPEYFDALAALGKTLVIKGKYDQGYPYLLRAININARCADCYYSLALSFYKLDELAAATKAIDAAAVLQPQAAPVRLLQGIIYRLNKDYKGAEKSLLLAKAASRRSNPEVHWQLSLVYNRLDRNEDAAKELEAFLKESEGLSSTEKEKVKKTIEQLRKKAEKDRSAT